MERMIYTKATCSIVSGFPRLSAMLPNEQKTQYDAPETANDGDLAEYLCGGRPNKRALVRDDGRDSQERDVRCQQDCTLSHI